MPDSGDERWMSAAVDLAWRCPPSRTAYSVGAIIVAAEGTRLSDGYSRENGDPHVHAEESALSKLFGRPSGGFPNGLPDEFSDGESRLAGATIYSTLEPCSARKSRPIACAQLIIASGVRRVVVAWREPALFVADCQGFELLEQAGLEVTELPAFAERAKAPNRHLAFLALYPRVRLPRSCPARVILPRSATFITSFRLRERILLPLSTFE